MCDSEAHPDENDTALLGLHGHVESMELRDNEVQQNANAEALREHANVAPQRGRANEGWLELSENGNAAHVDGNGVQRDDDDDVSLE